MKKKLLASLMAMTLLLSACGGKADNSGEKPATDGASEDTIQFKMAIVDNETTPYYKGAAKVAEEVKKATDGKIEIEVIAGGTLGGERDTVEQAMAGDLDIATAANAVLTNWIPEMAILDQAYLWDNADQAHAAIDGKIGELINEKAKGIGLHVIGYMESGFRDTFSTDPIDTIDDFKGVKIRTMANEYHMTAYEAFGAMPTPMAATEVFTALQQGTINAAENAVSNCLTNGFYEITKHITNTKHAFVYIPLCMSEEAWNKIPEDLQEPFLKAVQTGCEAQREYLVEANEKAVEELKDLGVTFHDIDTNVLKEAYEKAVESKNYKFDPEWQAACDEVK